MRTPDTGYEKSELTTDSGDRIALASYLGGGDAFDRAMASFAEKYADQNDRDFRALQGASWPRRRRDGRLTPAVSCSARRGNGCRRAG